MLPGATSHPGLTYWKAQGSRGIWAFALAPIRFCTGLACHSALVSYDMLCTQALLDVYTIQRELGRLDNLRVGLVGDLANGRTVRSLAYLLSMYSGIKFYFVAPDVVRMQVF